MDTYLLRIDLSHSARDYDPAALEPGVPLCDRAGNNYAILRRWLGTFVAEPVWNGDELKFFARSEDGGRLTQATCLPLTSEDAAGPLHAAVEQFAAKVKNIKPVTSTEKLLHRVIVRALADLTGDDGAMESGFWKYREGSQAWRLIWCWGYRRKRSQPATETICSNPECRQLFFRTPGGKDRCPSCATIAEAGKPRRRRAWKSAVLASLILLLTFAAGLFVAGRGGLHGTPLDGLLAFGRSRHAVPPQSSHNTTAVRAPTYVAAEQNDDVALTPTSNDESIGAVAGADASSAAPDAEAANTERPKVAAQPASAMKMKPISATTSPRSGGAVDAGNRAAKTAGLPVAGVPVQAGPLAGKALRVCNGVVSLGAVPVGTAFHNAHLAPGTVVTSVNGTPLVGRTTDGVHAYFGAHPLIAGDVVGYRTADGTIGETVLAATAPTIDGRAVREVRLVEVRVLNVEPQTFQAAFDLDLTADGDYRLVDHGDQALGQWTTLPAGSSATLTSNPITRTPGDDYELFVERRQGDEHKLFQVPFKLTLATP